MSLVALLMRDFQDSVEVHYWDIMASLCCLLTVRRGERYSWRVISSEWYSWGVISEAGPNSQLIESGIVAL